MTLKPKEEERGLVNYKHNALKPGQPAVEVVPTFEPSDPVIIEWRAMTVATLDRIAVEVRKQLNLPDLTLAQVLQGGTWNVRSISLCIFFSFTDYCCCCVYCFYLTNMLKSLWTLILFRLGERLLRYHDPTPRDHLLPS
jgi:hypothetical protein